MGATGRGPKQEEHAPSLFGWLRSATAKTRDEAEVNPRIGQANVGVSGPRARAFRIPRGFVTWIVTIAVIALLAVVIVPAVGGFIDGFGDAVEEALKDGSGAGGDQSGVGPGEAEHLQRRARNMIRQEGNSKGGQEFNLANCVTAAAGDPGAVAECNERLLDDIGVSTEPAGPAAPAPEIEELNKMADCVERAGSDIDRIVECTSL
jgi:hypothetical protein